MIYDDDFFKIQNGVMDYLTKRSYQRLIVIAPEQYDELKTQVMDIINGVLDKDNLFDGFREKIA